MNDIINIKELKQHILTGISYFIPLVVGAGLTMAIGRSASQLPVCWQEINSPALKRKH